MKGKLRLILAITVCCPLGLYARGITGLCDQLRGADAYSAAADFEVLLPSAADPIIYDIQLDSRRAPADTLAPCDYLIRWSMATEDGTATGFGAYFDGHHYRYRGDRVQEYHTDWDFTPFAPNGRKDDGVQRTAQFADLLPAFLAEKLEKMAADSTYRYTFTADTVYDGRKVSVIDGVQTIRGFDGLEYTYVFDRATGMPLRIELLSNPGSIAEQAMSVKYSYGEKPAHNFAYTEEALMEMYPEVFEKYRHSNFRIENLAGNPLPGFSAPTVTGERYTHERGHAMRVPTIVAILAPGEGNPAEVVSQLREAAASMPFDTDIIWAFVSNKAEEIEEIVGYEGRQGEHTLMNARRLALDAGATALPSILLTDADGKVTDVIIGFNNNLASDVIQKMALAN